MVGISRIKNSIKEYAWGSRTAIPELLGEPSPADKPQAELWMGAHPQAPSEVVVGDCRISLLKLIEEHPGEILGKAAAGFSGKLPFLFKVLAAAEPLSIQAHPNLEQAREGFERENSRGIPLDAFHRNYRDANHKPEIILALTPFWALNGFRPLEQMLDILSRIGLESIKQEIEGLRTRPDSPGLINFFRSLMTLSPSIKVRAAAEAVSWAEEVLKVGADRPVQYRAVCEWIVKLGRLYPGDIGVISPALLNLVNLKPGQAMFMLSGSLHAYLEGMGIELMANSDNVLRGGLTPKHVDVPELLKILLFEGREVELLQVEQRTACEKVYISPASEFELAEISISTGKDYVSPARRNIELMICVQGKASICDLSSGEELALDRGASILVPASVKKYAISGQARIYKAGVPIGEAASNG